jgi:hypothetical protein
VEFYVEQSGVVADALQEALVQDYDGTIRIAPALPPGWDFDGCVAVRGKTRVCVQTRNGAATTVAIEARTAQALKLRNPWPGQRVDVIVGATGRKLVKGPAGAVIEFPGVAGARYLVEAQGKPVERLRFAAVGGTTASTPKKLGPVAIGISSAP